MTWSIPTLLKCQCSRIADRIGSLGSLRQLALKLGGYHGSTLIGKKHLWATYCDPCLIVRIPPASDFTQPGAVIRKVGLLLLNPFTLRQESEKKYWTRAADG